MMNNYISALKQTIAPVRASLIEHPMYRSIHSPGELRVFMQHHVYAVWDFMSLVKALQGGLTCVSIPWVPVGSANTRFLINEIVVGEESDLDEQGNRCSHFELYIRAMEQVQADTGPIIRLVNAVKAGQPVGEAIRAQVTEPTIREFLEFTFDIAGSGKMHVVAAVFTFGREDLIPDMFLRIVQDLSKDAPEQLHIFKYYLERHIEVDGGHHSHLAMAMLEELCGDDPQKWEEATIAAGEALKLRTRLWDGVSAQIR